MARRGRPLKARLPQKVSRQIAKAIGADALWRAKKTHRDLAEAAGKSRSWVQYWLGEECPRLTFEAAHILVSAAYECQLLSNRDRFKLLAVIVEARGRYEKPDYTPYVVSGDPLDRIMDALADLRLGARTRSMIRKRIGGAMPRWLKPAGGEDPSRRVALRNGSADELRADLREAWEDAKSSC